MIYNSVLYVLVGSPLIGDVILVHCVQINIKVKAVFCSVSSVDLQQDELGVSSVNRLEFDV